MGAFRVAATVRSLTSFGMLFMRAAVRCLARLDMLLMRTALRAFTVARVRSSRTFRLRVLMRLFARMNVLIVGSTLSCHDFRFL